MKKCPFCAEEIQDEAIVCKHCGRELSRPSNIPPRATIGASTIAGFAAALFIVVALWFFLAFDVSVAGSNGERILNLGLLSERQNGIILTGLLAVTAVLTAFGMRQRRIERRTAVVGLLALVLLTFGALVAAFGVINLWEMTVLAIFPS